MGRRKGKRKQTASHKNEGRLLDPRQVQEKDVEMHGAHDLQVRRPTRTQTRTCQKRKKRMTAYSAPIKDHRENQGKFEKYKRNPVLRGRHSRYIRRSTRV